MSVPARAALPRKQLMKGCGSEPRPFFWPAGFSHGDVYLLNCRIPPEINAAAMEKVAREARLSSGFPAAPTSGGHQGWRYPPRGSAGRTTLTTGRAQGRDRV